MGKKFVVFEVAEEKPESGCWTLILLFFFVIGVGTCLNALN